MSMDPMMMSAGMGGSELDLMAMQEAMNGGASAGMGGETTTVEVPVWAVEAVQELVSILETEVANGNVTPDMLMGMGDEGGMPAGGGMDAGMMGGEIPPLPM